MGVFEDRAKVQAVCRTCGPIGQRYIADSSTDSRNAHRTADRHAKTHGDRHNNMTRWPDGAYERLVNVHPVPKGPLGSRWTVNNRIEPLGGYARGPLGFGVVPALLDRLTVSQAEELVDQANRLDVQAERAESNGWSDFAAAYREASVVLRRAATRGR